MSVYVSDVGHLFSHHTLSDMSLQQSNLVQTGDKFPSVQFNLITSQTENGKVIRKTSSVASHEFLANRRIVLFSVPAAFSPTCSEKHLPGFIEHAGSIKSKGVATIVCMSVNDSWVMSEWAKSTKVGTDIVMLADGNAAVAKSLGLAFDAGQIGIRARRFAMVIDNGVVKHLFVDDKGKFVVSGADTIMSAL